MYPFAPYQIMSDGGALVPDGVWFTYDHFLGGPEPSATDDAALWDLVGTSAGGVYSDADLGGVYTVTSNSTNVAALVQNGEPVKLLANRSIVWEARVNLVDADGMSFVAGIGITDSDQWTTSWTDYIGFFTTDGSINFGCAIDNDNVPGSGTAYSSSTGDGETDVDTGLDFADNTWARLKFIVDGTTRVRWFVDNGTSTARGVIKTGLPTDEQLTSTISAKGSAETYDVDYVAGWMSNYQSTT